ncbi:MAG: hypothetical protein M3O55_07155 [Actinomycetota bacterium]|nr:hypothetical protein [Actinomycetota bacterium]
MLRDNNIRVVDVALAQQADDQYFALAGNSPTHSTVATSDKVTVTVTVSHAPKVLPFINTSYSGTETALPISK